MKFVHIADMHFDMPFTILSKNDLAEERRIDQRKIFQRMIEYIKENNVAYLFIAGDLYENEYIRRTNELKKFLTEFKTKNKVDLVEETYNALEYFNKIKGLENLGERSKRCYKCYKLRMEKAAKYAKENNFDYFTTTLSISPYILEQCGTHQHRLELTQ